MKRLLPIALFVFLLGNTSIAQTSFTAEETALLNKFGISEKDHRGLILNYSDISTCPSSSMNTKEAIESFFNSKQMSDLTEICISNDPAFKQYSGKPLDMKAIASLYLEISTKESDK